MSEKNKRVAAKPYHDLSTPFTVDQNGAYAEYILQEPDTMPDLALGANVLVADKRDTEAIWVSARVVGMRAISPFSPARESLLYQQDDKIDPGAILEGISGPHTHQPMIIRVALDTELVRRNGGFLVQPVQRPPSAFSRLIFPSITRKEDVIEPALSDILGIRPNGAQLGYVGFGNKPYKSDNTYLEYKLDLKNLDNKHIFVVGESGSGKTVFLKNLAWQIRKLGDYRVILTDVQGDITQLLLPDFISSPQPLAWQDATSVTTVEAAKAFEKMQLVVPARKNQQPSAGITALKVLAEKRGVRVVELGLRMQDLDQPSDVEYLFRVASEQAGMLLDDQAQGIRSSNKLPTLEALQTSLTKLVGSNGQVRSLAGTTYLISTLGAAQRALKSLSEYFDFHKASMQQQQDPLNAFDFDGTTILYLEELDSDERMMWEMQMVKWLYENKRANWRAFVFFDEAHQIIPAAPPTSSAKGTFERLRVNFERLAREGRKFGINLVLSTQNPQDLHAIVPEQCPTRVVMKINPKNAKYSFLDPELAMLANSFTHGQFWVQSPFNGTPNWVRVHSPSPPLPHEPMTTFWDRIVERARAEAGRK